MEEEKMEAEEKTGQEHEKLAEVIEEEETEEAAEEIEKPIEEEAKPTLPLKEKPEEKEIVEERIYTIPLSKAWIAPPNKRAPKAIRIIKSFITKHMKLKTVEKEEEESKKLIISNEVNEKIWSRGIEKPPRKIRVKAAKDKEGNITIYLAEGD
jgi:large subunit ribosomal protein L31e